MDKKLSDALDHCLATDCQYTVDGVYGGRFVLWLADSMAAEDKSVVRNGRGQILKDYRKAVKDGSSK